jgi:hypothetical protein
MSRLKEQFLIFMRFKNLSERTQEFYMNAQIKLSHYYKAPPQSISTNYTFYHPVFYLFYEKHFPSFLFTIHKKPTTILIALPQIRGSGQESNDSEN